jgi:hypothetical protein
MSHDEDILSTTLDQGTEATIDPQREIEVLLEDLEALLKSGEVVSALTGKGINASLALLAAGGLRAYLGGHKAEAAEDLATAAEEIRARIQGGERRA